MRKMEPCWNATAGSAAERGRKMVTSGAVTSTQTSLPWDGGDVIKLQSIAKSSFGDDGCSYDDAHACYEAIKEILARVNFTGGSLIGQPVSG